MLGAWHIGELERSVAGDHDGQTDLLPDVVGQSDVEVRLLRVELDVREDGGVAVLERADGVADVGGDERDTESVAVECGRERRVSGLEVGHTADAE